MPAGFRSAVDGPTHSRTFRLEVSGEVHLRTYASTPVTSVDMQFQIVTFSYRQIRPRSHSILNKCFLSVAKSTICYILKRTNLLASSTTSNGPEDHGRQLKGWFWGRYHDIDTSQEYSGDGRCIIVNVYNQDTPSWGFTTMSEPMYNGLKSGCNCVSSQLL